MDKRAEQIKEKIKKLTLQLKKHEERHEKSIAKLIKDTSQRGVDVRVIAGMVLNAEHMMKSNPKDVEAWQVAGEKFLFKARNKKADTKNKPPSE